MHNKITMEMSICQAENGFSSIILFGVVQAFVSIILDCLFYKYSP